MIKCYYPSHLKHYIFEIRGNDKILNYFSSGISSDAAPTTLVKFRLLEGSLRAEDLGLRTQEERSQEWYWFITIIWGKVYLHILMSAEIPDITYSLLPPFKIFSSTKYLTTRRITEKEYLEIIRAKSHLRAEITTISKDVRFIENYGADLYSFLGRKESISTPSYKCIKRVVEGISDYYHFFGVNWFWMMGGEKKNGPIYKWNFELIQFENEHFKNPHSKTYFENFFN